MPKVKKPDKAPAQASQWPPVLLAAWPYALLFLLAVAFHWRLLTAGSETIIATNDIGLYFHWLHLYCREEFLAGRVPLWNPYNYAGMPFAANPQAMVFYPLSWLYLLVGVADSHRLLIVLHSFMSGAFMQLYLRRLGLGRASSLLGAIPYMLGGYAMANVAVGHLTMLYTMAWFPLALYCYERGVQSKRLAWMFWVGVILGLQVLAGEPQTSYYSALALAGYSLIRNLFEAEGMRSWGAPAMWTWIRHMAMIAVTAALVGAVQLILTAEFAFQSDRSGQSLEFATTMSLPPIGLFSFLIPWSNTQTAGMNALNGNFAMEWNHEFSGYVGLITLALAGASFAVRRQPALLAVRVMAVIAVVLMLGSHTPMFAWLSKIVPGLLLFRIPSRAVLILQWALSVMAAFGAAHLFASQRATWRERGWRMATMSTCIALLIGLVIALGIGAANKHIADTRGAVTILPLPLSDPLILRVVILLVVIACLAFVLRWFDRGAALAAMAVLLIIDLLTASSKLDIMAYDATRHPNLALMKQLKQTAKGDDLFRVDLPPDVMDANAALYGRVENINAYTPMALRRFYRFVHEMRGVEPSPHFRHQLHPDLNRSGDPFALKMLNVQFAGRFDEANQRFVIEYLETPMPRAWLIDDVEVIADDETALARLRDPQFNPSEAVILAQSPGRTLQSSRDPMGQCQSRRIAPDELRIEVDAARDGYLVISEINYPGWQAMIDNQPVSLERANYLINAIPISAGRHLVTYRYDPATFKIGAAITATTAIASCVVAFLQWRGLRRRSSSG